MCVYQHPKLVSFHSLKVDKLLTLSDGKNENKQVDNRLLKDNISQKQTSDALKILIDLPSITLGDWLVCVTYNMILSFGLMAIIRRVTLF